MIKIAIQLDKTSDKVSILKHEGFDVTATTGWGRAMSGEDTYYDEYHFFVNGNSACGPWMSMWNSMDHKVSDPKNCPKCVELIKKNAKQV